MWKMLNVAWREFASTALTKGFIIGIVLTPVMIFVVIGAIAAAKNLKGPRLVGTVALIDRTGKVADLARAKFQEESIRAEAREQAEAVASKVEAVAPTGVSGELVRDAAQQRLLDESGPRLTLEVLPGDADLEREKAPIIEAKIRTTRDLDKGETPGRLALVVVPEDALRADAAGKFARFDAYFAKRLDFEVQGKIRQRIGDAVVDARLGADERLAKSGLSPAEVRAMIRRPEANAITVSKEGERKSLGELTMIIPLAFMLLLMMSVLTSGQYLLTTTVEEKSSRVMEVLLAAVSPMQLMTGKILGQMAVGLLILVLYSGMGVAAMLMFIREQIIDPMDIVYLMIFFLIAYFLVASMMAAIGSAVNEMREAQTLMAPVMVLLTTPWLIWFLIQRAPNSPLATILSFVPGMNPFVMVIRLSASEPVPAWQIPVAILVGILSVIGAAWAAAKIFRVGALMYGKPPNLKTLVRWVRMA